MSIGHNALVVLIALAVDAALGDPDLVWRRLAHPVVLMGRAIGWTDKRFNRLELDESERRSRGVYALVALVVGSAAVGALLSWTFTAVPYGVVVEGVVGSMLLAQRSLYQHVAAVRDAFAKGGLGSARQAVSMIVGRDPKRLNEAGVSRAAIESLAENYADGVVSPVFWGLLFGLPGLFAYKAINTADSMIGHKTERHLAFGWAAARLDDLVNLAPARLSGLCLALAAALSGRSAADSIAAMRADAAKHVSPNAGWPEAAMGGALGVALGGPRVYSGVKVDDPYMNAAGDPDATPENISEALQVFVVACVVHAALVGSIAAMAWLV